LVVPEVKMLLPPAQDDDDDDDNNDSVDPLAEVEQVLHPAAEIEGAGEAMPQVLEDGREWVLPYIPDESDDDDALAPPLQEAEAHVLEDGRVRVLPPLPDDSDDDDDNNDLAPPPAVEDNVDGALLVAPLADEAVEVMAPGGNEGEGGRVHGDVDYPMGIQGEVVGRRRVLVLARRGR
jgi:hypothetical protein